MKYNLKIRFSKDNLGFWLRAAAAVGIPVLAYLGVKAEDLTSWAMLGEVLLKFITNPYLMGLTLVNVLNIIPDPTVASLGDSEVSMNKKSAKESAEEVIAEKHGLEVDMMAKVLSKVVK